MKDPRIDGFQGNNQEQIKTEYKRLRDTCQGHLKVIKDSKGITSDIRQKKVVDFSNACFELERYCNNLKGYVSRFEQSISQKVR